MYCCLPPRDHNLHDSSPNQTTFVPWDKAGVVHVHQTLATKLLWCMYTQSTIQHQLAILPPRFFVSRCKRCSTAFRDLLTTPPPPPPAFATPPLTPPAPVACPPPPELYDSRLTFRATRDFPRSSRRACSRRPAGFCPVLFLAVFFETLLTREGKKMYLRV